VLGGCTRGISDDARCCNLSAVQLKLCECAGNFRFECDVHAKFAAPEGAFCGAVQLFSTDRYANERAKCENSY
jgi:hypothetical protein